MLASGPQAPRAALVTRPTRLSFTLVMVLACSEPSSVIGQLLTPNIPLTVTVLNATLNVWLVLEKFLAEADPASAPKSTAAPTADKQLASFMSSPNRVVSFNPCA